MRSLFLPFLVKRWPVSRISQRVRIGATLLATAALVNCSGHQVLGQETDSCDLVLPHSSTKKVDAATFWTNPPEKKALDVLTEQSALKELTFTSTERENRQDLQLSLIEWLILDGDPLPDVYQVNGGSDVLQFALAAPLPTTEICALDSLDRLYDFRNRYFEAAWLPAICQGSLYSVPLNIHRINTGLFNLNVYGEYLLLADAEGREFPADAEFPNAEALLDFLEWAAQQDLETANGEEVIPFSLGIGEDSSSAWPITLVAFESFLASYGNGIYESIWQGGTQAIPNSEMIEGITLLAEHLRRLGAVGNLADALSWQDATKLVVDGSALMTISGDWIRAAVDETLRDRIVTRLFPGTQGTFVYTPDSFSVPRRSQTDGSSAHAWFRDVINDKTTQLKFAREKQAIPALANLKSSELASLESDYLIANYEEFADCQKPNSECRLLLAVSGLGPAGAHDPCFDQLGMILATIAGQKYPQEIWNSHDCETPIPQSSAEAEKALVQLLLDVSARPFARRCRAGDLPAGEID